MMNNLKFLGLLIVLVSSITAVTAQESGTNAAITLERTACRGVCPVYAVTIFEDGTVIYQGESSVTVTGEQTSQLTPEIVQIMVEAFADVGYFDWDESYETETVADLPTVITSVSRNGETHRIARYVGDNAAPLALPFLENWIDEMVNTELWKCLMEK